MQRMQKIKCLTILIASFVVLVGLTALDPWVISSARQCLAFELASAALVDEPQDKLSEIEVRRELNRLLGDKMDDLGAAVKYLDKIVDQFPTDSQLHLIAISLHVNHGTRLLAEEKADEGKAAYFRAAAMAQRVVADPKHMQAIEPMLGEVFVFAAQAHALDANEAQVYQSLDQAFELGFDRFDRFDEADAFKSLRQEETFQKYLVRQKGLMGERMQARLRKQIESFQSFDFDFQLTAVDGKKLAKSDYHGKVLVVDVWGTWCPPCRKEIPNFIALQNEFAAKGVQVVGLNVENEETVEQQTEIVQQAIEDFKINYPCALIDTEFLQTIPNFEGFPTTLLLDATGKVRLMLVGAQPEKRMETAVQLLLEQSN